MGRLVYYKGFEYLIRAMQKVRGRLIIIGDGPLRQKLTQLVADLGLADKVVFAGEIQNAQVTPYYHASDLFALASIARSEAFGIVQIEAMAAGPARGEYQPRFRGPVCFVARTDWPHRPARRSRSMAAAINRLLDNPDLRTAFGRAATLRAKQEFAVDIMASRTLALYDQILHPGN